MPNPPAFTAVSTSQKLKSKPRKTVSGLGSAQQPKSAAQPQPSAAKTNQASGEWPPALKSFLEQCFIQIIPENKAALEVQLKQLIARQAQAGQLWTTDWASMSLPILEQQKRAQSSNNNTQMQKSVPKQKQKQKQKEDPQSRQYNHKDNDLFNNAARIKRQKRFEKESSPSTTQSFSPVEDPNNLQPIVGRSTQLEKRYLRLTSAPDPDNVRPLAILEQTLTLLKHKWKTEQNYAYVCDQFKSLRQDLTVQHIENEFTVQVYEIHARIALEKCDLGEYNQCQSRLKELYKKGINGHETEFLAYRILYLVHTQNRAEIAHILRQLVSSSPNQKNQSLIDNPVIAHALQVNSALISHNYNLLFQLYNTAPNMGGYVMDAFIKRERLAALDAICTAYRGDVPISVVCRELRFETAQEGLSFIKDAGVVFADQGTILPKESMPHVAAKREAAFSKVDIKGQL